MATIASSVNGYRVQVEVQFLPGIDGMNVVGLPDAWVKESKDRVMAALYANDCLVPDKKIVVNLSPAEEKKHSPIFDLAMAIGIMKEAGVIKDPILDDATFLDVLLLDETAKPVDGMLPAIIVAKKEGFKIVYLPGMKDLPINDMQGSELRFKDIPSHIELS